MQEESAPENQNSPGKKNYSLQLSAPNGDAASQKIPLAGLPADSQWRLQGSVRDRGMLRNGLAYEFGRVLFPRETPDTRYCEVLFKRNGRYYYEGIYILSENPERLLKTVGDVTSLLKYSPDKDRKRNPTGQAEGAQADRLAGDEAIYGWSLEDQGFSVVNTLLGAGNSDGASRDIQVETEIGNLENVLDSLSPGTFLTYESFLNQDSVIDFFILNSLLLNAHESSIPLLLSRDEKKGDGKFTFLPIWNFDAAMDNTSIRNRPLPFEEDIPELAMPSILSRRIPVWRQLADGGDIRDLRLYPVYTIMDGDHFLWFDRLFLSRPFLTDLFARYHELRRGPLAPAKVSAMVDLLAEGLGPALERDWARWHREYTAENGPYSLLPYTDSAGKNHIRQTYSFDQELAKIRHLLREQDVFLMGQLAQMGWLSADLFDEATSGNRQAAYALITMVAFLFLTYMLTRRL